MRCFCLPPSVLVLVTFTQEHAAIAFSYVTHVTDIILPGAHNSNHMDYTYAPHAKTMLLYLFGVVIPGSISCFQLINQTFLEITNRVQGMICLRHRLYRS